jgi:hypothetical protein
MLRVHVLTVSTMQATMAPKQKIATQHMSLIQYDQV